ncbi:Alpha-ketoglutarate-dependent dioxygenase alkB 7, mitochondrial [Portunus trituberculatus]|uniref:Alpha-ketoglutarate-dependent dioxygenase alkB 7, mitochondrial n=1 Tax=Portunus trituberculatus TaxID=210409 RepID=A0A5B7GU23_PORTR|nr:Alpha-ketoglutarate-dependent dioxygenase alkB 7, mitochondrial [Portunus trituberculatus]
MIPVATVIGIIYSRALSHLINQELHLHYAHVDGLAVTDEKMGPALSVTMRRDFCGNTISGLCLLSDAVMRLRHVKDESRYNFTHEILGEEESFFRGITMCDGSAAIPTISKTAVSKGDLLCYDM